MTMSPVVTAGPDVALAAAVDVIAAAEHRSRARTVRVLLREALDARATREAAIPAADQ
jgi:hypothetical protein